jgi:pimeloyl-ACP methyl ester carboxylesterase
MKRPAIIVGIVAVVAVVGVIAAKPFLGPMLWELPVLGPRLWKLRSHVQEMPLAGATVSLRDLGEGAPAVVIISGMGVAKDDYYTLQQNLSRTTRVLAFDRPGIGESTPNVDPRTLDYIDRDLKAFLDALAVPPPYIFIGHSLGGHIIRYYANKHPGEVAGLVFLDAPHENWPRYIRATWTPDEVSSYFKWWSAANPDYAGVAQEEMLTYETNCDLVRGIGVAPEIPVLMFTGDNIRHFRKTQPGLDEDRRNWIAMQASMLDGVRDARHLVDLNTGHWMHQDKPDWVAGEIGAFINKVRSAQALQPTPVNPRSPSPGGAIAGPATSSP